MNNYYLFINLYINTYIMLFINIAFYLCYPYNYYSVNCKYQYNVVHDKNRFNIIDIISNFEPMYNL